MAARMSTVSSISCSACSIAKASQDIIENAFSSVKSSSVSSDVTAHLRFSSMIVPSVN